MSGERTKEHEEISESEEDENENRKDHETGQSNANRKLRA